MRTRVLLVDDDPAFLMGLSDLITLHLAHVAIETSSTGLALGRVVKTDYDAIVSGVNTTGIDGLTLLKRIRVLRRSTPILLITPDNAHTLSAKAFEAGAYTVLSKPIDPKHFCNSLSGAIRVGQVAREGNQLWQKSKCLIEESLNLLQRNIPTMLRIGMRLTNANMGNIQVVDRTSGTLKIVAQEGFDTAFLTFFNGVHQGQAACGTALEKRQRIIIEDITTSPIFVRTPNLDVMRDAGVRAVQSTPLISHSGDVVGILSTHYRHIHMPSQRELDVIDLVAKRAAHEIVASAC